MSQLDLTNLIPIYQQSIDSIIDAMGKSVTLYFEDTIVHPDNTDEILDDVRGGDRRPSYKTDSPPIVTKNTKSIKALIKYNPEDFKHFGLKIDKPSGVVRLKTFLTDVPDLTRCKYIVPNDDSASIIDTKYRLLREAIPVGLGVDRYAITFWERI